jgi:hypothetical protein
MKKANSLDKGESCISGSIAEPSQNSFIINRNHQHLKYMLLLGIARLSVYKTMSRNIAPYRNSTTKATELSIWVAANVSLVYLECSITS